MEIKRELLEGELSSFKNASLPIFAAIGGMLVPALIFTLFNHGTAYQNGWGIPMATDIAFSLAIISMLDNRVPASIKIFLTALAIVDDLGAIIVIAIFYTEKIETNYLLLSGGVMIILIILNFLKVKKHIFYIIPGIFLWYFMHHSGIHATIAGVLLAFTIPTNMSPTEISPLEKLEEKLHFPVSYVIMPIFALANAGVTFSNDIISETTSNVTLGVAFGLIIGKVIGVYGVSLAMIKIKVANMPEGLTSKHLFGVGFLAAIGFTMSLFVTNLAFNGPTPALVAEHQLQAKLGIFMASLIAGLIGYFILKSIKPKTTITQ